MACLTSSATASECSGAALRRRTLLYGPNSNGGEVLFFEEHQSRFLIYCLKRMMRRGIPALEVRQSVMERFNRWLQRRLQGTVFGANERGYYRSPTGTIVTQWNQGLPLYWLLSKVIMR